MTKQPTELEKLQDAFNGFTHAVSTKSVEAMDKAKTDLHNAIQAIHPDKPKVEPVPYKVAGTH